MPNGLTTSVICCYINDALSSFKMDLHTANFSLLSQIPDFRDFKSEILFCSYFFQIIRIGFNFFFLFYNLLSSRFRIGFGSKCYRTYYHSIY
ncbi:hypothetical protein Hdeb2414_s0017g00514271 [Helianthus debilis subsp. tardiflorus]